MTVRRASYSRGRICRTCRARPSRSPLSRAAATSFRAAPPPPAITLIATGSEVQLAVGAARELEKSGVSVRVVSMPCTQVFDRQPDDYRDHVLPPGGARLVVEAGATGGWWRYVGERGNVLGLDRFGHSAPAKPLFEHFGFTVDAVVAAAKRLL